MDEKKHSKDKHSDDFQHKLVDFKNINRGLQMQILTKENKDIKNLISDIVKEGSFMGTKSIQKETANKTTSESSLKRKNYISSKILKFNANQTEENNSDNTKRFLTYGLKSKDGSKSSVSFKRLNSRRPSKPDNRLDDSPYRKMKSKNPEFERGSTLELSPLKRSPTLKSSYQDKENEIFKVISNEKVEADDDYNKAKTHCVNNNMMSKKQLLRSRTMGLNGNNSYLSSQNTSFYDRVGTIDSSNSIGLDANTKSRFKAMAMGLKRSLQVNFSDSEENDEDDEDESILEAKKKNAEMKREKSRKVMRMKLVYDSFSDEEIDEEAEPYFIIHPDSYFRLTIELVSLITTLYTFLLSPIYLAFHLFNSVEFVVLEIFIDVTNFVDMVTGFFTGYHDMEENTVINESKIINHYLFSWFPLDIICTVPLNSYYAYIYYTKGSMEFEIWQLLVIIRVLKAFKVILYNNNLINPGHFYETSKKRRFFFASLLFLLAVHMISCIYIFLGKLTSPNWMTEFGLRDAEPTELYVASFYFICSTIFTIGYGDILSVSIYEKIYNLLLLMIGIMIYSYAVSALSNYVQESDEKTQKYERSMTLLQQMKMKYTFKESTFTKISRFLKYEYSTNKIDNNSLLSELPISIRNEIMYHMYRDMIDSFVFFRNFDNLDFINRVLLTLKPIKGIRNEILIKEGDLVEETIFIKRGILSLEVYVDLTGMTKKEEIKKKKSSSKTSKILQKLDQLKIKKKAESEEDRNDDDESNYIPEDIRILKIIQIRKNEHFGDVLMFLNQPSPLTVRVKTKFAELFLMHKIELANIARDFPDIFRKIYSKSVYNMDKIQSLISTAKTLFFQNQTHKTLNNSPTKDNLTRMSSIVSSSNLLLEEDVDNKTLNSELAPIYENRGYSYQVLKQGNVIQEYEAVEEDSIWQTNKNLPEIKKYNSDRDSSSDRDFGHKIEVEKNIFEDIRPIPSNITHIYEKKDNSWGSLLNMSFKGSINEEVSDEIKLDKWKGRNPLENDNFELVKTSINSHFKENNRNIINNGNINIINHPVIHRDFLLDYKLNLQLLWANSKVSNQISFSINGNEFSELAQSDTKSYGLKKPKTRFAPHPEIFKRSLSIVSDSPERRKSELSRITEDNPKGLKRQGTSEQLLEERDFFKGKTMRNENFFNMRMGTSDIKATRISNSFDDTRIQKRVRQKEMMNQIHENIVNSNLNIYDPESYYKKWLIEIHNKRLAKTKKNNINLEYDRMTKRLDKLEDMFKENN
jgi:hypothetical protein